MTLSAFAAERGHLQHGRMAPATRSQLSIDISCPQSDQQQTRQLPLLLSIDGTDGLMDGRPTVT